MKNTLKTCYKSLLVGTLTSILVAGLFACKQRDDYPDFSNLTPPETDEDIIPPDNDRLAITNKIMAGTDFFKTFLIDSSLNVSNGIAYYHIRFLNNLDQKVSMHIVEIDQTKAHATMEVLSPFDDYLYSTQELPEMMSMNQETISRKLMVGIVGGAASSGNPTASYVKKSRPIKENTSKTIPYLGVKKSSDEILFLNSPDAGIYPTDPIVLTDYKSLVGGQNWMLYNGNDVVYTTTTTVARTSVGMTENKNTIYCIAVDGVNDFSAGIALNNLREIYKAIGCHNAFYTHGSGSNSLGIRDPKTNEFVLKNIPQSGNPGSIANAIGFSVGN